MYMEYSFFISSMFIFGFAFNFFSCDDLYYLYEKCIRLGIRGYFYLNSSKGDLNENEKRIDDIESETLLQCNNYLKDLFFKMNWKVIEFITLIREFNKKTLRPKFHELTDNYFRKSIKIIYNGYEIYSFKNYKEAVAKIDNVEKINYDFILHTNYHKTESKKNYTIISDKLINNYEEQVFPSEVGFIIFQLKFGDVKYDIDIKEPKNYLIKDNVLKSNFFKYYMRNAYNINIGDDFSITYMTNDMSTSTLNNPFFIKFNDIGITSFPIKKEEEKKKEGEKKEESLENEDIKRNLISNIINQEILKEHRD